MTYKEYLENLRAELITATDIYEKAEKKLSEETSSQKSQLLEDFTKAKINWQNAANSYNTFFDFVEQHKINLADRML